MLYISISIYYIYIYYTEIKAHKKEYASQANAGEAP